MTDGNVMAQDAADDGQVVFRLKGPTDLYEGPSARSSVLETLPEGSLITIRDDAGPFLHVVTAAGWLGYIRDTALVTLAQGSASSDAPGAVEEERSRRRDALIFVDKMQAEAERLKKTPIGTATSPGIAGIVSAAVGLLGLLAAHAISGMMNEELMVFFALDILLPLVVLTANPKAPLIAYQVAVALYLAMVAGYVAI